MGLDAAGKGCKIEVHADDDGVRLICNTVDVGACPLNHPGELGLDCLQGEPAAPDSHMVVGPPAATAKRKKRLKRIGGMMKMPEEEEPDFEENAEVSLFEEAPAPAKPEPPKKDVVKMPEPEDDGVVEDQWFEQVIEEFETVNDYVFGLVVVKDDEGDLVATMTIDNVNIDIRMEDFIEMARSLRDALPKLKAIYMES